MVVVRARRELRNSDLSRGGTVTMAFKKLNQEVFDYYPRLSRLQQFVNQNYCETITLDRAAKAAVMEATYFSHYFKKKVGICFSEWLRQLRIKKAMEMLLNSNQTITYIAYEVGFEDLRTFERTFKKYVGMTPIEYRVAEAGD